MSERPGAPSRLPSTHATRASHQQARAAVRAPATSALRARGLVALTLTVLSTALLVADAGLERYFDRGIVWSPPPSSPMTAGPRVGMNVFLEKEPDPNNVVRSVRMLRDARVTMARQTFSWAEIEPAPGVYVDPKSGQSSWAKYDFIVEQLRASDIEILARIDTIPRWARAPTDDVQRWDKAPPQDFNNYANFAAALVSRYQGKIGQIQVWNEPNLQGEWGGRPIDPAQYGLLLKFTYERVKPIDPKVLVVTAGLAQTIERGPANLNELDFIRGLYDSGAAAYFDVLSVMAYGLGSSPYDRRVSPERTNFSRLQLARDIMVQYGDGAKPIWVSEFGWLSLPRGWTGEPGSWGASVSENVQARYIVDGLNRTRDEWPWVGAVFVWAFRWVEPVNDRPNDPARYFEVVDYDFVPRPAYVALSQWIATNDVASTGVLGAGDPRIKYDGAWREQQVTNKLYRIGEGAGAGARLNLAFHGTDLKMIARTGPRAGSVYVLIDGVAPAGLPTDNGGAYLSLRNPTVVDSELTVATGLTDAEHRVELRIPPNDALAVNSFKIGKRRPLAWVSPLVFAAALAGLFAGMLLGMRVLAVAAGWLPSGGVAPKRHVGFAWWDTRE